MFTIYRYIDKKTKLYDIRIVLEASKIIIIILDLLIQLI